MSFLNLEEILRALPPPPPKPPRRLSSTFVPLIPCLAIKDCGSRCRVTWDLVNGLCPWHSHWETRVHPPGSLAGVVVQRR